MNPLLLAGIANVGGGLLGNLLGAGDRSAAVDAARSGQAAFQDIAIPDVDRMRLLLEEYASAGNLSPEEMQALQVSLQDQLSNVQTDPRLKQAQMDALSFLEKTGQGGLTPIEAAELARLRQQTEADSQSRIKALLQQQDTRGVGSSDMALAARMQEAQAAANRQAQGTSDIAGQAFQRALQSMAQGANLAGSMEQSDYARQAALADAQRAREMADWQNRQDIMNQNVQARNTAQQFNLQNQQNLLNQNVGLRNTQQQYNKELLQREFENRMDRARGISGAAETASGALQRRGDSTANMWQGIGSGIAETTTNMWLQDEKDKDRNSLNQLSSSIQGGLRSLPTLKRPTGYLSKATQQPAAPKQTGYLGAEYDLVNSLLKKK